MDAPTPAPASNRTRRRPLDGVRVLDLTRVLSGPHCTRMLCDLGAEVIKVEPPAGDMTRFSQPRQNGMASYFAQQNVGKRNLSLDLSRPEALPLLLALVERCDVLVENFRPGVVDRMGIGWEAVRAPQPADRVRVDQRLRADRSMGRAPRVRAGGRCGERVHEGAGGSRATAAPSNDPHSHADVYTGMECAAAILAALYQREQTGVGDRIDVSMAQTMLYVNEHVHDHLWDGPVDPSWIRSFRPGEYPVLTAADGQSVVISGHPAERGTFDGFMPRCGARGPARRPGARRRAVAARPARRDHRGAPRVGCDACRTRRRSKPRSRRTGWPPARCGPCARSPTPTGPPIAT